jgi:hypothetical protein
VLCATCPPLNSDPNFPTTFGPWWQAYTMAPPMVLLGLSSILTQTLAAWKKIQLCCSTNTIAPSTSHHF